MRTLLFGLDGATFTVLDHLIEKGLMPNLKQVYAQGVRSKLLSTEMPITPQAWTSMATGRGMGHHGINDFARVEVRDNQVFARYNTSLDVKCETIWQYASDAGQRVTAINYIILSPPRPINGHTMPGFVPARHLRRSSYPANLFEKLESANVDLKILGLDFEVEKVVLSRMPDDQWLPWITHHIDREKAWFRVLEHLMLNEPSDLTAIVLDGVDKIQHLAWRFLDPERIPGDPSAWESDVIEKCHEYFQAVDGFIGRAREILGKSGRMFIASDHGFTASTEVVYINNFLHDQGWLTWKGEVETDQDQAIYTERLQDHLGYIDIPNTRAFALTPSCNGIFINVPKNEYESFRNELIEKLYALTGPDGGKVIRDVKTRERAFPGPYMHFAPDLTLELRDFGLISVLNGPETVVPRDEPWGTHHPDGVLLGVGAGLRQGEQFGRRNIVDVTSLLVHSIGIEIPEEFEGEFPTEFYDPDYLMSDPPRVKRTVAGEDLQSSTESPEEAKPVTVPEMDEAEQTLVLERLRNLGYIE